MAAKAVPPTPRAGSAGSLGSRVFVALVGMVPTTLALWWGLPPLGVSMSLAYWGWHTSLPCSPWLSLRAQVVLSWDLASLSGYLGVPGSSGRKAL